MEPASSLSQSFPVNQPIPTVTINQDKDEVGKEPKYLNNFELECSGNTLPVPLSEMDNHESSTIEEVRKSSKNKKRHNSVEFRLANKDDRRKLVGLVFRLALSFLNRRIR